MTATTTTAQSDCDYCTQPGAGQRVRLDRANPASPRVDVGHDGCYREFMAELSALNLRIVS